MRPHREPGTPVIIAPAMDLDMYKHPSTVENLQKLNSHGCQLIKAEYGELASGLVGEGRMAEPEWIISFLEEIVKKKAPLKNKKALITAGPTYESIDPVRFIGNHSTGKMGYAIAETMAKYGAEVELISGPTQLKLQHSHINITRVINSTDMFKSCELIFPQSDITILTAAVADYRPTKVSSKKIKKQADYMNIELEKTIDIAEKLGKLKRKDQFSVGFALETDNEFENAKKKLVSKNFDMIVLNSLNDQGAGFGFDTNKIKIIDRKDRIEEYDLKSKTEVARDIVNSIIRHINE